jgi:hypothetical protein
MTLRKITLCHYDECHYAECRVLFFTMLSVVMLNVVKLNVVMLSVDAPQKQGNEIQEVIIEEQRANELPHDGNKTINGNKPSPHSANSFPVSVIYPFLRSETEN